MLSVGTIKIGVGKDGLTVKLFKHNLPLSSTEFYLQTASFCMRAVCIQNKGSQVENRPL